MGDINYEKAEREVEKAVQQQTVKNLVEGKTVKSSRAMDYYGTKEDVAQPRPEDRVERLMSEIAAEEEDTKKTEKERAEKEATAKKVEGEIKPLEEKPPEPVEEEGEEEEEEFIILTKIPTEDTLKKARKQSPRTPKRPPVQQKEVPSAESFTEPVSALLILRKHLLWFKRLHMDDRYEKLGTTKDEIGALRKADRLSEKQVLRVQELNKRAEELKKEILKKTGKESLEELVEKEKIRHKRKRFKTRETWIQL